MPAPAKVYPQDALIIIEMLKEFGINDYEPGVISQILEFGQRYVLSVLEDAKVCSEHAQKRSIDNDDLKLAVMMQLESKFTTPPPRDLMLEVARPTNNVSLPFMKPFGGIVLPPKSQNIMSCSFRRWKKTIAEPPRVLNFYGSEYRRNLMRTSQQGGNVYITRDGRTFIRPLGKFNQQMEQRRLQQQQVPPKPRIYPSQQFPPLPFPYPKYMKPIVVYVKEEPVSPIPEVENDLPPNYIEDDDL